MDPPTLHSPLSLWRIWQIPCYLTARINNVQKDFSAGTVGGVPFKISWRITTISSLVIIRISKQPCPSLTSAWTSCCMTPGLIHRRIRCRWSPLDRLPGGWDFHGRLLGLPLFLNFLGAHGHHGARKNTSNCCFTRSSETMLSGVSEKPLVKVRKW